MHVDQLKTTYQKPKWKSTIKIEVDIKPSKKSNYNKMPGSDKFSIENSTLHPNNGKCVHYFGSFVRKNMKNVKENYYKPKYGKTFMSLANKIIKIIDCHDIFHSILFIFWFF